MNIELTGKVIAILEAKTGTSAQGKQWKSQNFIIESDGEYKKKCSIEIYNDKISVVIGSTVKVSCNVDCNEYKGAFYNKIQAWKVEVLTQAQNDMEF